MQRTCKCELVEIECDICNYITYVFKLCDEEEIEFLDSKYVMCVRYPNWDHRMLDKGEVGYLTYNIVIAGIDTWGQACTPYKYSAIQFVKFVDKKDENEKDLII
jgi:hypothetical protein